MSTTTQQSRICQLKPKQLQAGELQLLLQEQQAFIIAHNLPMTEAKIFNKRQQCLCCLSLMSTIPEHLYSPIMHSKDPGSPKRSRIRRERVNAAINDSVAFCTCGLFYSIRIMFFNLPSGCQTFLCTMCRKILFDHTTRQPKTRDLPPSLAANPWILVWRSIEQMPS